MFFLYYIDTVGNFNFAHLRVKKKTKIIFLENEKNAQLLLTKTDESSEVRSTRKKWDLKS